MEKNILQSIITESEKFQERFEKENYILSEMIAQINDNNYDSFIEIGRYVIDNDIPNRKFSPELRMKVLYNLIERTIDRIQDVADNDEDEMNYYFGEFYDLLWYFKWVLPDLPEMVNLEKEMIFSANDIMKHHYSTMNFSLAMYHKTLMLQNIVMGDVELAKENFSLWQQLEDDGMSDCPACELAEEINYFAFIGDYEKVVEISQPILSGKMTCAEVPHIVYGSILKSMVKLGKLEDAKKYLPKAVEVLKDDKQFIKHIPDLIEVAVKLNDIDYARELAEANEEYILTSTEDLIALKYFIATAAFKEDSYDRALTGAKLFDERNGNSYYTDYIAEYLNIEKRERKFFR